MRFLIEIFPAVDKGNKFIFINDPDGLNFLAFSSLEPASSPTTR